MLEPVFRSDPVERTLILSDQMNSLLTNPPLNRGAAIRLASLRADLEVFVKGERISVCMAPYKATNEYLARLDTPPDEEVWDIRSRNPRPGLRVIGRFAEPDVFVAFTCSPRSKPVDFLARPPLGDGPSVEWENAIAECQTEWRKLFFTYKPLSRGAVVRDYVSSNAFLS